MIKKFAYSFGAVATGLSYQAFSTYIIFFYVDVVKLPVYLAGIGMLIYAAWNAVNDPLFGFISDSTHTRWGRRIPYLIGGAAPFALIFFLLWVPPFRGLDQSWPLFWYFLIMLCLFDGFYSLTILNWAALFPEMFSSLRERTQVNVFRQTLGMIGLMAGIALPPLIYSRWGWGWMGAVFGGVIFLAVAIAILGSREKLEYSRRRSLGFLPALKATLQSRAFLTFVFANLFVQYAFTLTLASIPFFGKYILDVGPEKLSLILAAAFLSAIPMLYVWGKLTLRFGAKRCFLAAIFLLALFLSPLFFVREFNQVLLAAALIGSGLAGFILTADILIADVIDEDERKTGARREGMFFGMNAFVTRLAIALEAASISLVFVFSGYNPYVFTQTREFYTGIRVLLAGLPILALTLAFGIMWWYPLKERE